jgi:hypothetical protein
VIEAIIEATAAEFELFSKEEAAATGSRANPIDTSETSAKN